MLSISKGKYHAEIVLPNNKTRTKLFYDFDTAKRWLGAYVLLYPDAVSWWIEDITKYENVIYSPSLEALEAMELTETEY